MFSQFHSVSLAERELEPARSLRRAEDSRETVGARDFIIKRNSFPVPQSSPGCLGGGEGGGVSCCWRDTEAQWGGGWKTAGAGKEET